MDIDFRQARPEQLFSGLGGVVDISMTPPGASPLTKTDSQGRVSTDDPTIDLVKTGRWYRLPAASGTSRIYTVDLGADAVPISVIACPGWRRETPTSCRE